MLVSALGARGSQDLENGATIELKGLFFIGGMTPFGRQKQYSRVAYLLLITREGFRYCGVCNVHLRLIRGSHWTTRSCVTRAIMPPGVRLCSSNSGPRGSRKDPYAGQTAHSALLRVRDRVLALKNSSSPPRFW